MSVDSFDQETNQAATNIPPEVNPALAKPSQNEIIRNHVAEICDVLSKSDESLMQFAIKLYGKKIIGAHTKKAAIRSKGLEGASKLMDQVELKVKQTPVRSFEAVVSIMEEIEDLQSIGHKMCNKKPRRSSFSAPSNSSLIGGEDAMEIMSNQSKIVLDSSAVLLKARDLQERFSNIAQLILSSIARVDVKKLMLLLNLQISCEKQNTREVQRQLDELESAETPNALLNMLINRNFIGYLNYELIKVFPKVVQNKKELTDEIQQYEKAHDHFLQSTDFNTLVDVLQKHDDLRPNSAVGLPKFTLHLESPWDRRDVYTWKELLDKQFNWPSHIHVTSITKNCIIIEYSVLPFFAPAVVRDLTDRLVLLVLKRQGVVKVNLSPELIEMGKMETTHIKTEVVHCQTVLNKTDSVAKQNEMKQPVLPFEHFKKTAHPDIISDDVTNVKELNEDGVVEQEEKDYISAPSESGYFSKPSVVSSNALSSSLLNQKEIFEEEDSTTDNDSIVTGHSPPQLHIDHKQYSINDSEYECLHPESVNERIILLVSRLTMFQRHIECQLKRLRQTHGESSSEVLPEVFPPQHPLSSPEKLVLRSLHSSVSASGKDESGSKAHTPVLFPRDQPLIDIMDSLMYITETPSKLCISMQDFKESIIFRELVSSNLLLAIVGGLPNCGKSKVIHELLKTVVISPTVINTNPLELTLQTYVPHGLSSYGVVIVGRKPFDNLIWMPETMTSSLLFSCGSAILHSSLLQGQQVELVDTKISKGQSFKGFKDSDLNAHLHQVYEDVDTLLRQGDLNPEIKRILPSGITTVKIIDTAMNQGVYDFLALSARYCCRQFGFAFLDLERDVPFLDQPPEINPLHPADKKLLQSGSRIYFLIRFAAVTYFSANCPSTLFVALHNGNLSQPDVDRKIDFLRKAICDEIERQGLPQEMVCDVMAMNRKDSDLGDFKKELEKMVMKRHSSMIDLKLSWVFLRSFLRNSPKYSGRLCISLEELQPLAREMKIDTDIEDFLKVYTECGSFLYIPDILPKRVILRPAVFIHHLQSLFYFENSLNGLIAKSEVQKKLGEEVARVVIPAVCNSGLGIEVQKSRIIFPELSELPTKKGDSIPKHLKTRDSESFLFIPSTKTGDTSHSKEISSLFIVYQSKIIPPVMAGKFLKRLLPKSKLISTPERNAITVKLDVGVALTIVFHFEAIELKLQPFNPELSQVCQAILLSCSDALSDIAVFFPGFTYKFALLCLKSGKFEYVSLGAENQLCDTCKIFPKKPDARKGWHNAVKAIESSTKSKDHETLSLESLTKIATNLHKVQPNKRQLATALGIDKEEWTRITNNYVGHKQILSMLLAWVTRVGAQNATKQRLFDLFFQAEPHVLSVLRNV